MRQKEKILLIDNFTDDKQVVITPQDIEFEHKKVELNIKKEELVSNIQDRTERKRYADKLFVFLSVFVAIMLLIVFLNGFNILKLDNSVIITLISTTAANIIGIFIYVVKYLFQTK